MFRKFGWFICALVMGATLLPAAALADDPHDQTMRNAAARARDRAAIKRMNQDQLDYVRQRDARTMRTYSAAQNERDSGYARDRADYERKMAAWRHAVSACNAGRWDYCDN